MALQVQLEVTLESGRKLTHCRHLRIEQPLFDHHRFQVEVPFEVLEGQQTAFLQQAHQTVCGKAITFSFRKYTTDGNLQDGTFRFKGIVTEIVLQNQSHLRSSFILQGYAPTYLLEDGPRCRTFLKQNLSDIVKKVLRPYPADLIKRVVDPTDSAQHPYLVQYKESNYAFISRLAAHWGQWLYYDGLQWVFGQPVNQPQGQFITNGIQTFSLSVGLQPLDYSTKHYNSARHQTYEAQTAGQSVGGLNSFGSFAFQTSQSVFGQPAQGGVMRVAADQSSVDAWAKQWKGQQASNLVWFKGRGEEPDLTVGQIIDTGGRGLGQQHSGKADFGRYRIVSMVHEMDEAGNYRNQFEALAEGVTLPPPSPWNQAPTSHSELAEVIDLRDPDKLGRVKVRYYWPVDKPTDAETDWLRVSTPYSGDGKGQLFTPEVGSQVLIGYESNRVEIPVVLGNLLHPENKAGGKYGYGDNEIKGLRTKAGNKITLHDKAGQEKILISNGNQKSTALEVGFNGDGSITLKTNGPISLSAGGNISIQAGGGISMQAGGEIVMQAKKDIKVGTEINFNLQAKENTKIDTKILETISTEDTKINADAKVVIKAASITEISGSEVEINQA